MANYMGQMAGLDEFVWQFGEGILDHVKPK